MSFDDRFDKTFSRIEKAQKFAFTGFIVMALVWLGVVGLGLLA